MMAWQTCLHQHRTIKNMTAIKCEGGPSYSPSNNRLAILSHTYCGVRCEGGFLAHFSLSWHTPSHLMLPSSWHPRVEHHMKMALVFLRFLTALRFAK